MNKFKLLLISLVFLAVGCENNKDYLVTIHTAFGDMKVILYDETPLHKQNFIELAQSGEYDSTMWHRVIEGFMIQGGDVYTKKGVREPIADRIPAEIVPGLMHTKGALAAARQGDAQNPEKKSSGCQFYIIDGRSFSEPELTIDQIKLNQMVGKMMQNDEYDSLRQLFLNLQRQRDFEGMNQLAIKCKDYVEDEMGEELDLNISPERLKAYTEGEGAPHLDNEYTIFGRVVEGLEVIDQIAAVTKGPGDKPVKDIFLTMEVDMVSKKEITEKYDYEYPETK